jgi:glycosyltransferase involved in cell wall biosynthesis
MRVGLLIYGSLETISGGYLYDRKLVEYLRSQDDQVEIVSMPWRSYPGHLLDNFSRSLLHSLRNLPVDVLIQDELNHPSLAWLNGKLQVSFPVISLVHHLRCDELRPGWQNRIYRQIERRYLDSVDGFIFNSQTTQQSVARVSAINERPRVIATPAGDRFAPQIDTAGITERANQPGPLRLIFVGNLIPRKGLHTLIEALVQLPRDHCTLDVIGGSDADSAYARRIFKQVENLGLQASVQFHGAQDDQTLANLIEKGQILAVPSSYEGFGIVYLEGMGFGLPCIGTTLGAAREIILSGETGYLIEPGDSTGLAAILKNLYHDRKKLTALSLAARRRYQQFPGWQQSMTKVRRFLIDVVDKRI